MYRGRQKKSALGALKAITKARTFLEDFLERGLSRLAGEKPSDPHLTTAWSMNTTAAVGRGIFLHVLVLPNK
jgi:hypothetical protein